MLSRRAFGAAIPFLLAAGAASRPASAASSGNRTGFDLRGEPGGATVSASIVSLSYETTALRDPSFFAPSNTALVKLFRQLNPGGVLRIGGNTLDWASLEGFDEPLPVLHPLYRHREQILAYYPITRKALTALAGFLDATGWKVIFGIDLRAANPDLVTRTAELARECLGERLIALQVGNEANNYFKSYSAFYAAWRHATAGTNRADIGGPDTGANTDWVLSFGRDVPEAPLLSRHYYRDAATNGSIVDMLHHDAEFDREIAQMSRAASRHRHGFWLTEANSYYLGGAAGVSDTFASALWGLDFTLSSAANGARGICYHGGPKSDIAESLGPSKGADLASIAEASSVYSPIGGNLSTGFAPRPIFFGLVCARLMSGYRLYVHDAGSGPNGLRVYAGARDAKKRVIALNLSDTTQTLACCGLAAGAATRLTPLAAPSLEDREHLTFGSQNGPLLPGTDWTLTARGGTPVAANGGWSYDLPAKSALLVDIGPA